ncbi:hypothetical protein ACSS6W_000282 [Trichoderma asperelloides]
MRVAAPGTGPGTKISRATTDTERERQAQRKSMLQIDGEARAKQAKHGLETLELRLSSELLAIALAREPSAATS